MASRSCCRQILRVVWAAGVPDWALPLPGCGNFGSITQFLWVLVVSPDKWG